MSSNFEFLALEEGSWFLAIPDSLVLDDGFLARAHKLSSGQTASNTVFCGAGFHHVDISVLTRNLVSFCFDQLNSPTLVHEQLRVKQILKSPLLIHKNLVGSISEMGIYDFEKLLAFLNRQVILGELKAVASSKLAFGSRKILRYPIRSSASRALMSDPFATKKTLTIVTRTLGNRPHLLQRCIESVAAVGGRLRLLEIEHLVVDGSPLKSNKFPPNLPVIPNEYSAGADSRLGGLKSGLAAAKGDYILFLDDDDTLNFEIAQKLEESLTFDTQERIFFFDSQQVFWRHKSVELKPKKGFKYQARLAPGSYLSPNQTPICSAIYPRGAIVELLKISDFERYPKVLEDHLVLMMALNSHVAKKSYVTEVLTWINIHGASQSVLDSRSQDWINSASSLRRVMIENHSDLRSSELVEFSKYTKQIVNRKNRATALIFLIFSLSNWRSFYKFGLFRKLFTGELSISEFAQILFKN